MTSDPGSSQHYVVHLIWVPVPILVLICSITLIVLEYIVYYKVRQQKFTLCMLRCFLPTQQYNVVWTVCSLSWQKSRSFGQQTQLVVCEYAVIVNLDSNFKVILSISETNAYFTTMFLLSIESLPENIRICGLRGLLENVNLVQLLYA